MSRYNLKELEEKVIKCKQISIEDVNIENIDKLADIKISKKKKGNERILDYIKGVSNPYMLNINGSIVKIDFVKNNKKAEECIASVISKIYK